MADTIQSTSARQMAGDLAHNIRNPLHAIRLNLYTLRLAEEGACELSASELHELIEGSEQAIDRVDRLVTELVQMATSTAPKSPKPITEEP